MRLAHVENERVPRVAVLLQGLDADLRNPILFGHIAGNSLVLRDLERTHLDWLLNTAELVVVDQFGDRRVRAADRAVGILAQLQRAEGHAQCVDQQETAHKGLSYLQNQLDRLGRLDHADQAGQNAEHATLRAARHQARRRRLRVQAAVARALRQAEHARLALKAEDRSVGVRLA